MYLRNIIPTGNKDLCNRAERCAVRLGVDLRADGSDGNLIERTPMTPIPPGYKPLPGTIIWDVDEFPIWYEDYELVHRDQQLGGERVGPD